MQNNIVKGVRKKKMNFFKYEKENYCKPVRVNNFWSNNYIECESMK